MNRCIILMMAVVMVNGVPVEKTTGETLQGTKRANIDLANAEQNAGKAVLKLLDAKIGKKVQDAAKEVTDFLTSAIGHHASSRTTKIQKDKEKEMSLLHLSAIHTIKDDVKKHDEPHLKKKKDGSFLVHFKIPYIVTPLKKKKHHHHHHKHHYHHHHHPKHHYYHHKTHKTAYDKPPAIEVHRKPYHSQQALSPYHHPGTAAPSPYTQTQSYSSAATQSPGNFPPCQGMCTAPCTPDCTPATDCCCCPDPNAAVQPAAVPLPSPPVMLPPPIPLPPNQPPLTAEQFAALPVLPGSQCLPSCKRHCVPKCPLECCGDQEKRNKVEKPSVKKEDKPEKKEETQESETQQAEKDGKQETKNNQTNDQQTQISEDQRDEGSVNESTDDDDVE